MLRKRLERLFLVGLSIALLTLGHTAAANPLSSERILVLYKERDPDHVGILNLLTSHLKQAGYEYDSRDVEKLLVNKPDMSPYTGIMTVYQTSQMVGGDLYPAWLVEQMEAGRRILIIGSYGAYQALIRRPNGTFLEWNESTKTINTFFYPFGLEFYFAFTGDTNRLQIVKADKEFAQYQQPILTNDLKYFQLFKSVNSDNQVYFSLKRSDMIDSESALNVITPFGGMIIEGYSYYWDPDRKKTVYRVNFSKFMKKVFSAHSQPVAKFNISSHAELVKKYPLPERAPLRPIVDKHATELSRRILVLYKKSEAKSLEELPFYNRAAMVLEYLGLIPVYHAVEDGLPEDPYMQDIRGIATWNTHPDMIHAQQYGEWLLRQIKNGKRVAILQEYGASYDLETQKPSSSEQQVFEALGLRFMRRADKREQYIPTPSIVDPEMMGYERKFDPSDVTYSDSYTSNDPANKVFLSFSDREFGRVDLGVITHNGGVSLKQSPFYFPAHDVDRVKLIRRALKQQVAPEIAEQETLGAWYLNPYRFFTQAFALQQFPAPDVTTLNGSRIFYAHIDGDGLSSISLIDGAHSAGFQIYENILKKYIDIPTSVSVITKFVERSGNKYYSPAVVLARNIFKLPNVDMAVHAATHPFDWVGGDPYIVNPDSYPYKVGYKKPNLLEEIWGAKLFADKNLAPPNKETTTLFWSGATNPDAKALEIVWRAGMHNLNGGDPRFDDEYPSIAGLTSYSLPYEPYRQYLTSAQNDYIYTLFLTGDWGGQKKLMQHFKRTETPHRVYPMNLYYHFYSGIKQESLDALHYIYDYVRSIDAAPIFATNYLEIVEDFYNTRIGKEANNRYWVENNGFLRTIRFNFATHIDMRQSQGVVGYSFHNNETYVHLDGRKRRIIVLADTAPNTPYFIQASQFVDNSHYDGTQFRFNYRGFGKTLFKIGGLRRNSPYQLAVKNASKFVVNTSIKTDNNGVLIYRTSLPAPSQAYQGILQ